MPFPAICLCLILVINISLQQNLIRHVPFATITETLRSRQKAACDGDILNLTCPAKTQIFIREVHYGRTTDSPVFCPPTHSYQLLPSYQHITCTILTAYSAVTGLCQGKQHCAIVTSPASLGVSKDDPCPGIRKNIEIQYHCVAAQFVSTIICSEDDLKLKCDSPDENISVLSSFVACGAKNCHPNDEYKPHSECKNKRFDVTHSVLRSCHGRNSCIFRSDKSLLSKTECELHQSFLNITYTCMSKTNFHPEFLNKIFKQEIHQIASKKETFKPRNEADNIKLILTAESKSPERSTNQYMDNSKEQNTPINNEEDEKDEMSLSLKKNGYMSDNENLSSSQALNLFFQMASGFQQVTYVLQKNTLKFVSLLALSVVLPVACFAIFILSRTLVRDNSKDSESETSGLDSDLL